MRSLILNGLMSLSLLLVSLCAAAQSAYTISGTVADETQKPLAGATVFIDGSKLATATNADGKFAITVPGAGSYRLSAKMLGYAAGTKELMLKKQSATIDFALNIKPVVLNQVTIGTDKNWAKHFAVFKRQFLGTTPNAMACKIVNPQVINFSTGKNMLYADADEFLIIENPDLGYRIKYLLKRFQHNELTTLTAYDGDVVFEEQPGTDKQKKEWAENRRVAYNGSLMHFMRSVFNNTALQDGFIACQMYQKNGVRYHGDKPVRFDTLVTAIDTSFVAFKFTALQVTYDPDRAGKLLAANRDPMQKDTTASNDGSSAFDGKPRQISQLASYVKEVFVDAQGRVFSGYLLSFLIRGDWTYRRVADQLPFEYQPPTKSASP